MMEDNAGAMSTLITEKMVAKQGLKHFGSAGANSIMTELKQLVYQKVMEGCDATKLTTSHKKTALHYLILLKQ